MSKPLDNPAVREFLVQSVSGKVRNSEPEGVQGWTGQETCLGPRRTSLNWGQSRSEDGVILSHILWEKGRGHSQTAQPSQQGPGAGEGSPTSVSKKPKQITVD